MIRPYTSSATGPNSKDYSPLVAGGVARTIAVAVISPIELFRTRLQAATTGIKDFQRKDSVLPKNNRYIDVPFTFY